MTLQEIKDIFKEDLTIRLKKDKIVFLKNCYVMQEIGKGVNLSVIALELKHNRQAIYNSIYKQPYYEFNEYYQLIKEAFNSKDFVLYSRACYLLKNRKYPPIPKELKVKAVRRARPKKKEEMPEVRWHYLRIIQALRKDNRHKLWEKPMKEFTINDYKVLESL
jgi:hypothetical protein